MTNSAEAELSRVEPSRRVLLLSHCLRRTETCRGKYTRRGLDCAGCDAVCAVNRLRQAALALGYKGVCVAPGGRLALTYIQENRPGAVVAVACQKELEEGVHGVSELTAGSQTVIPIVVVPLSKDGCVDTEVDVELVLEKLALGCPAPAKR